ncbi:DoxX family membrane protein [Rhodocytophaga aerolata]|uniref:DoxX family membrane protein n=1 Tax=Rhodocytophaga aerolata TaxID=455078 RepID=A0ABT8RG63_9BACT|nr:DoxX family membrane protein [Rhodocytophaga aerolata]MDO1451102.1 DoxX family membrane protein [Rhodocytophaga aerolata]
MKKYQDISSLLLRVATAANFLSPVADRFGLWGQAGQPGVAWGNWQNFVTYTGQVNSFAPQSLVPLLAIAATVLEVILALLLLVGFQTRVAALGSAFLTLLFALAMSYSFGIKAPLDYAVFVDCSSAFLLATLPRYRWSLDEWLRNQTTTSIV